MSKINIMSLGGLNENGKNLYLVSVNSKILIFDCGMKYAPEKMYGVDYVIPDFTYLVEHKKDIVGVFISHPHRENMGALTDLVKAIPDINVYASAYTSEIIKYECMEDKVEIKNLHVIKAHRKLEFNSDFSVFPFSVTHSSPETLGYSVNTKDGAIIYMADFVIDPTMSGNYDMDLGKLAYIGKQGVLCLMAESVFAEKKGHTSPNHKLESFFKKVVDKVEGRIIFTVLPLHIYTIQEIFNSLKGKNRKVVIMGRKTLEALPNQSALVGRKNIVLTRNKDYEAKDVCLCHSVEDVLEKVKNVDSKDVYVIGGGKIYKEFLPYCDTAHITKVDYSYEADTYISDFDKLKDWRITGQSDEHTYFDICYEFVRYERKGKADEMPE